VEIAYNRDSRLHVSSGTKVPLQITNPKDEISERCGSRIDVDAKKLVRVNSATHMFKRGLGVAERGERFKNFTFETLEVFESNVEEVAGAAGGIEDADIA
jgi:hypothetical protein